MADEYVKARMRGLDADEAATEAGYSGRPTYEARSLWVMCETLLEDMTCCPHEEEVEEGIIRARVRIGQLQMQMRRDLQWLRAIRLVRKNTNHP